MENVVVYNEGELELKISINNNTIWLNQIQMSNLFDTSVDNISLHLKNIYKDKELDESSTVEDFSIVRKEGNRTVKRKIKHYNLDAIISIGYRVSSFKATKFRQWATSVLKNYIENGYTINSDKITNDRFVSLENDVNLLKKKINVIEDKHTTPTQGIFYNGQIFDAHSFVSDLIRGAKSSIKLIDNYVDDITLSLFSKNQDVCITIYTNTLSKSLKVDLEKYNKQYKEIDIKINKDFHDRFLIIDDIEVYHIGASLKDLGKKVFAFSKMDVESVNILII